MDESLDLVPAGWGETLGQPGTAWQEPGSYDYLSGAIQSGLALGTTYLSRRLDIDLQSRLAGSMPAGAAVRRSSQPLVLDHADVTTRVVANAGGLRIGDVLPWAAAGLVAWLFLRRA